MMKRAILAAALIGLAVSPLAAGGKGAVTGSYVEARTAEVFTGGYIMNSEAETVGKQAVLAWKVDRGSFNGIAIDGLSIVAARVHRLGARHQVERSEQAIGVLRDIQLLTPAATTKARKHEEKHEEDFF